MAEVETRTIKIVGVAEHGGRTYKLARVRTRDGTAYLSLRLYDGTGKLLGQMMVEPEIHREIAHLFEMAGEGG